MPLASTCRNRVVIPDSTSAEYGMNRVRQYTADSEVTQTATAHGVVMWWCLDMDTSGNITLSTAPKWVHPHGRNAQWRDHWMQATYFLKKPLHLKKDENLRIYCCHDDYSIWFDVEKAERIKEGIHDSKNEIERPICSCGAHIAWSRHRISMINDKNWFPTFYGVLKNVILESDLNRRCFCISDCSLLPVVAAISGFEKVIALEHSSQFISLLKKVVEVNNADQQVNIVNKSVDDIDKDFFMEQKVDLILGEPFFSTSLLPWHNLYFWYASSHVMKMSGRNVKILPSCGTIKAVAVEFRDLWKFHDPVEVVEGFDVKPFNELITRTYEANQKEDGNQYSSNCVVLEPHHIWEYPNKPLTNLFELLKFDFTQPVPDESMCARGEVPVVREGICHAVVLWMDFYLTDDVFLSTGLVKNSKSEKDLRWVKHTKQGVFFMRNKVEISAKQLEFGPSISFSALFTPKTGDIQFDFRMKKPFIE